LRLARNPRAGRRCPFELDAFNYSTPDDSAFISASLRLFDVSAVRGWRGGRRSRATTFKHCGCPADNSSCSRFGSMDGLFCTTYWVLWFVFSSFLLLRSAYSGGRFLSACASVVMCAAAALATMGCGSAGQTRHGSDATAARCDVWLLRASTLAAARLPSPSTNRRWVQNAAARDARTICPPASRGIGWDFERAWTHLACYTTHTAHTAARAAPHLPRRTTACTATHAALPFL